MLGDDDFFIIITPLYAILMPNLQFLKPILKTNFIYIVYFIYISNLFY